MGSLHLPATSHIRSGLTRHHSALCVVIGASLGLLIVVRPASSSLVGSLVVVPRYASLLGCHWPVLVVAGGPPCRRSALCVIVGPSSSSLGCHLARTCHRCGSRSGPTHRHWNITGPYSFSLGLVVVGSSFPHAGVIRVAMVGVGWSVSYSICHCWVKRRR
jgi:hypothetical protein